MTLDRLLDDLARRKLDGGETRYRLSVDEHAEHHRAQKKGSGSGSESGETQPGEAQPAVAVRLVEHARVTPSPLVRTIMAIPDDEMVTMMEEIGVLDYKPLFLRSSYFRLADSDQEGMRRGRDAVEAPVEDIESVFRLRFGADLGESEVTLEAVRSDRRTATVLGVASGSPLVLRQLVLRDTSGDVRELSFTHFRADRVTLA